MSVLEIHDLEKNFGKFTALKIDDLVIDENKYVVILGPSGSGKTTLLRILAGLESQDKGSILISGTDISNLPAWKRDVGLVFQNYALYPHLNVFQNIAMPLNVQRYKDEYINEKVNNLLKIMELETQRDKYPKELSGGQQQRVALARALIKNPKILLMDEPLSNLDTRVRIDLREYLKETQRKLGITTIHVTHDQEEAMAIGDQIIVINKSKIIQNGTSEYIYNKPKDTFIARFLGNINLTDKANIPLKYDEDYDTIGIRYHGVKITQKDEGTFNAKITNIEFYGYQFIATLDTGNVKLRSRYYNNSNLKIGDTVGINIDKESVLLFKDKNLIDLNLDKAKIIQ